MRIILDNTEIDITLDTEKTWGDLFSSLERELQKNEATITEVQIDSKNIAVSEFDSLFLQPIDTSKKIHLKTVAAIDVIHFFKQTTKDYKELCAKLVNIPAKFQSGKDSQVLATIKELADSLDLFFNMLPYMNFFPDRFAALKVRDKSIPDFLRDFSPVLDEFLKAFENRDIVLLGDIAEYEIVPRLEAVIETGTTL